MTDFVFALVLLLVALVALTLRKTYYYMPARELKRQAKAGDALAKTLHRAVSYGASLRLLLWLIIGLSVAGSLVLLTAIAPGWLTVFAVAALVWFAFAWQPATTISQFSVRLVVWSTPVVVWLLNYLHGPLERVDALLHKYQHTASRPTGLYEREDLLDFIHRQKFQPDSRILADQLELVERALNFGDHYVRDILVPRKQVVSIAAGETVGPSLLDELHKSHHTHFPVHDKKQDNFVGVLNLHDLSDMRKAGLVSEFMNGTVYYVHESDTLADALHAFYRTNHALFIVINSFDEYVGILTVKDLVRQVLGHLPGDDFEVYADRKAVAGRHPKESVEEASEEIDEPAPPVADEA